MSRLLTLDASVFVAACNAAEPGHASSVALLAGVKASAVPLVEPLLLPVEVAAALRRARGDAALSREYAAMILRLPHVTWVPVATELATRSVALATAHALRGADAIYAATADWYGSILVTLDKEQRARCPADLVTASPDEAARAIRRS